jgi:phosphatidylglycerol:prolipoprotein diacylglycerol transferase
MRLSSVVERTGVRLFPYVSGLAIIMPGDGRPGRRNQQDEMEGLTWDIDPTILVFGPFEVRYYGVIFACVLLIGYYFWRWQMRKAGFDEALIIIFPYYIVILGIIGARLGHCFFYEPAYFIANPVSIIKIWRGGLSSHGAVIGGLTAIFLYSYIKKIPWHFVLDSNAFVAALVATLVRIGNFLNSEIVGRVTDLPWCVHFVRFRDEGKYCRHPSQLYEAAFGLAILLGLILLDRKLGKRRPPGLLSGFFLVSYFSCRFLVEFVKEYQALPAGSPLTMGQYLSIPFFLSGVYLLFYAWRHRFNGLQPPGKKPSPSIGVRREKGKKRGDHGYGLHR